MQMTIWVHSPKWSFALDHLGALTQMILELNELKN